MVCFRHSTKERRVVRTGYTYSIYCFLYVAAVLLYVAHGGWVDRFVSSHGLTWCGWVDLSASVATWLIVCFRGLTPINSCGWLTLFFFVCFFCPLYRPRSGM